MAYAPNPSFTKEDSNPIVIQNKMPKQGEPDVTGTIPGGGGGVGSTFRLVTSPGTSTTPTTSSPANPYPTGYTSGIPKGLDTVSGPGASYTPGSGSGGNGSSQPWRMTGSALQFPGLIEDRYPVNYSPQTQGGQALAAGGQWRPTGEQSVVGNPSGMQTRTTTGGDQAMYHVQGTPPPPGTTGSGGMQSGGTRGGGGTNGGGGSPYLGPPGLGGGGQQQGGGASWTPRPDYSTQDRGPLADILRGRVGYYHPGTGISTAGTPYANPGYGNPAGQWTPGYQAPSWMGGGYRGGSGGGGGNTPPPATGGGLPPFNPGGATPGPGMPNPNLPINPSGGDSVRKDIRNMDSGSGPTGGSNSGGGSGGGWRTAAPSQGSPYLGPPNQVPPYPTLDPSNPPTPEALLQMVRDWWAQWQAANPGGGPGPNFPGMVPTGATGVQSVYPPGAWERMQAIWPWNRRDQAPGPGGPPAPGPITEDPYSAGDYLKSQRPGSGPGR